MIAKVAIVALAAAAALAGHVHAAADALPKTWTRESCTKHVNGYRSKAITTSLLWEGKTVYEFLVRRELVAPPMKVGLSTSGLVHDNVCRYNYNENHGRGDPSTPYKVCANYRDGGLFNSRSEMSTQFTCRAGFVESYQTCLTGGCTADMQQSGLGTPACTEDEFIHKYDSNGDEVGKTPVPDRHRHVVADSDYISCEHHIHTGRTCHPLLSPSTAPQLQLDLGVSYRCKDTTNVPLDLKSCWKGCDPNTGACKERDYVVDICKGVQCGRMCVDRWPQLSKMHKTVNKWVEQSVSVLCVHEKIVAKTICRSKCDNGHGKEGGCT